MSDNVMIIIILSIIPVFCILIGCGYLGHQCDAELWTNFAKQLRKKNGR